jgi:hypothetical protein
MATGKKIVGAAIGVMVAIVLAFFLLIYGANLAPEAATQISTDQNYSGKALMESLGVLSVVLGLLLAVIVLIFASVLDVFDTSM